MVRGFGRNKIIPCLCFESNCCVRQYESIVITAVQLMSDVLCGNWSFTFVKYVNCFTRKDSVQYYFQNNSINIICIHNVSKNYFYTVVQNYLN